jgi:hypothetical protein
MFSRRAEVAPCLPCRPLRNAAPVMELRVRFC